MIFMCALFTPTPTPPTAFDSVDETLREMCPRVTNLLKHLLPNVHDLVFKKPNCFYHIISHYEM